MRDRKVIGCYDMNKIVILPLLMLLVPIIFLCGCEEEKTQGYLDERFFGNWENQIGVEVRYASNGSFWSESAGWYGTWEVKNGKICNTQNGQSSCYKFSFSEDDTSFTVYMDAGNIIYTKKQ